MEIRPPDKKELYSITVMTKKFFPYTHFNLEDIEKRAEKNFNYLVAIDEGRTIGFIDYTIEPPKIFGLAVLEEHRGKGVGKALLKQAVEKLVKNGAKRIELLTTLDNEVALKLYDDLGFKYVRPHEHTLPGRQVVIMAKDL